MSEKESLSGSPKVQTALVCKGTGCLAGGSDEILEALRREVKAAGLKDVKVDFVGCHGFCQRGPIVDIEPEGYFYTEVQPTDAADIVRFHLAKGQPVERLMYHDVVTGKPIPTYHDVPFYALQKRVILKNCGHINPERIEDYLAIGGYNAIKKGIFEMTPEKVIDELKRSGLRGRGGAGFPTGQKWEFCRMSPGNEKYLICNADEGDPGAFMDRSILEADPHSLLEGMLIAANAIGCTHGYIYCRAEYPLAIVRLGIALNQMREHGLLGKNILGSNFSFDMEIKEGAGAFVCGEETALMASIEGKRGMPRPRPPFPANAGLWGKPTNINNVKSLVSAQRIIDGGAEWYSTIGTEKSKGTVVFALTGKTKNCGLIEVPMGMPLSDIIFDIGGGIINDRAFKAVQTGGPSGGCLPANMLHLAVDYETLAAAGSIVGSGGMVVVDEDTCMVDLAKFFLSFTQAESCGKCVPCRVGTRQMLSILERITRGEGKIEDIDTLTRLAERIKSTALCALGGTAPNPVLTTLRYFRDELEEHIKDKRCRAGVCKKLVRSPCQNACPAGINVPRYIRSIGKGKYGEAVAVIREKIPLPSVCGYVCVHFCEEKCRRGQLEQAVAIKELKRFATDHDTGEWKKGVRVAPSTGKKVGIIGSGPAGLTVAYYLAERGHKVTIFEALPVAGGMMRVGIPSYRLPTAVLERDIKEIENLGVDIKTNSRIESVDELLTLGYDAVFIGVGAHKGISMRIEGEDAPGVVDGVAFLREVALGKKPEVGDKVLVVGGGNVAIDAARTALRLGAKDVSIIYRRTRAEMPASAEEIDEALEEGIKIVFLANPTVVKKGANGKLDVTAIRMELGKVDDSGRHRPVPIKGSEFTEGYDLMLKAVGQESVISDKYGIDIDRGRIKADSDTLVTSRPGVFAGGDVVSGPASVIEAIAAGRKAARAIDLYLGGTGCIDEQLVAPEGAIEAPDLEKIEGVHRRPALNMAAVDTRIKTCEGEVSFGFDEAKAGEECGRCLRCDYEFSKAE